ncbi:hypothetical protein M409DRAFT_27417 [Zasmidium cellare ATCC 36951]|uniref:Enoyl reductase (ER) domain-containing protein n=1 Tax=Zasmidium cellare ATCC 36951 TaxID=1080233 RepID=A0A6A6C4F5_ZASCE|nr:uncharacterized protein M409DRAFT_27417 [Zasmidium cellare ATCC 36951]KAF2162037.1 hypothetical protein M409DRAFT_27417 [Zasmidium cellare ATCC 36951]
MVQNKALKYAAHPSGKPVAGVNLTIETREFDTERPPPPGGITVKVHYVSFDPHQRGRMRSPNPSHTPAFDLGKPVTNSAILRVLKSDNRKFEPGNVIYSFRTSTEEYTAMSKEEAEACEILDNRFNLPASYFLGALGMPGLKAYSSLYAVGKPKAGETIFISAASGAVGQLVRQLAKREGLKVFGSVGSDEKVDMLTTKLGFDGGFNYKRENAHEAVGRLMPEGLDIYYENAIQVGGEQLEAAIEHINDFGRIVGCGAISQYNLPPEKQYGVKNLWQIVQRSVTFQGFIFFNPGFADVYHEKHQRDVQMWLHEGSLKAVEHVTYGIENAAEGLLGMLEGKNVGKPVLQVSELP